MKASTYYALMSEFETAQIPLEDLCDKYFDMNFETSKRYAAKQKLPVAALKLRKGNKCSYFIKAEILANHIDEQTKLAEKEWKRVNN